MKNSDKNFKSIHFTSIVTLLVAITLLASCDILGVHQDDTDEAGIVFGKRIADIQLGDSLQEVIRKHGPINMYGEYTTESGYTKHQFAFSKDHPLAGIAILVWAEDTGYAAHLNHGIVDHLEIGAFFHADSLVDLSTKDSIRINVSTSTYVSNRLGDPYFADTLFSYDPMDDTYTPKKRMIYCAEGSMRRNGAGRDMYNAVDLRFRRDTLRTIRFGYFKDNYDDASYCKDYPLVNNR